MISRPGANAGRPGPPAHRVHRYNPAGDWLRLMPFADVLVLSSQPRPSRQPGRLGIMEQDTTGAGSPLADQRRPRTNHLEELRNRPGRVRVTLQDDEDDRDDDWCEVHGLDQHLLVHEAGHVVAAVDFGIDFVDVVVYGEDRGPSDCPAQMRFASEEPASWAAPNPVDSLRFALAGMYAEIAAFREDHYPGSGDKDMVSWRIGVGLPAGATDEDRREVLKRSSDEVDDETASWAVCNVGRIEAVAEHLAQLRKGTTPHDDVVVSSAELRSFLASQSEAPISWRSAQDGHDQQTLSPEA